MATNGIYGTNIGANITSNDVDIFYSYSPSRNLDETTNNKFKKLESIYLKKSEIDTDEVDNTLEGMYNLQLPLSVFNQKGFYSIYIKPKEYKAVIQDVGVLSAYPDVKGIIIDIESVDSNLKPLLMENNALVGYRIIYFDNDGNRENYYRIVTSNNKCEPIVQNLSDVNQKSVRYRYNDNSTLSFITVTPSVSTTYKPNDMPYIGSSTQNISIVNTKFEPILLEIEMVDHDIETVSTMLEGSQLRDLDHGLVTTYNSENEIYAQHEHYTLKDEYTGKPVYEVKKNKENSIDFSQTLDDKIE